MKATIVQRCLAKVELYCENFLTISTLFSVFTEVVVAGLDMMPGQIPDPSLAAGSLPSLGPLAGISATTLTDQLKLADFRQLGTMLSPLHFLGRLGKRPLSIKTEVRRKKKPWCRWMTSIRAHDKKEQSFLTKFQRPFLVILPPKSWLHLEKQK